MNGRKKHTEREQEREKRENKEERVYIEHEGNTGRKRCVFVWFVVV